MPPTGYYVLAEYAHGAGRTDAEAVLAALNAWRAMAWSRMA